MKRFVLLLTLVVEVVACQKPEEIMFSDGGGTPTTRSITPNVSPVFDWWDTTSISLLGINSPVTLPWYNGASTQIPYYMLDDYKPEDGWEMVYNYCIDTPPGEEGKYYLMFYNKFTGILRVFYYNNHDVTAANTTLWRLEVTEPTSMFNALGRVASPASLRVNNPVVYVTNLTDYPSKSIAKGWNCFDIELAYDEQLTQSNAHFNIGMYNMTSGEFKLHGEIELETEGTIVTHSSAYPGWVGDASKAAGDGVKDYLQEKLAKTSLKDKIANIVSGGVSSLISSGAKFFLGALVGKKDNSYSSSVQLTTTGEMTASGDFRVATTPNTLPLANNLVPGCAKASDDSFLPSYDEPLGVWNVEELPPLYADPKVLWTLSQEASYNPGSLYYFHGEQVYYFRPGDLKIKVNPDVLENISHYSVNIRCIYRLPYNNPEQYEASFNLGGIRNNSYGVKGSNERYYTDSLVLVMDSQIPSSMLRFPINPYIPSIRGFIVCGGTFYASLTREEFDLLNIVGSLEPPKLDNPYMIVVPPRADERYFFYQVELTLYPKEPYNTTPIVSIRTYKAEVDYAGEPGYELPNWELRWR